MSLTDDLTTQLRRDEGEVRVGYKKAVLSGLKRYFSGKACPKGHIDYRWVSTRTCVVCAAHVSSEWAKNNVKRASARKKKWYAQNVDKQRHATVKRTYGLSQLEYQQILDNQKNACAICGCALIGNKNKQVDHCHKSGKIRGILCLNCNSGLGRFNDDASLLEKAIMYLKDKDCDRKIN